MVNPFQFVILVLSLDSERKGRNLEMPQLFGAGWLVQVLKMKAQLMKAKIKQFEMFHLKKGNN